MSRVLRFWAPVVVAFLVFGSVRSPKPVDAFDYETFGQLPVLLDGRVQPLDTVARNSLLILSSKSTPKLEIEDNKQKIVPVEWLARLLFEPEEANQLQVIRIHNEEIKDMLGLSLKQKDFSMAELSEHVDTIEEQADAARLLEAQQRDAFQRAAVELHRKIVLHLQLSYSVWIYDQDSLIGELNSFSGHLRAPSENPTLEDLFRARYSRMAQVGLLRFVVNEEGEWRTIGATLLDCLNERKWNPIVEAYVEAADAYRNKSTDDFDKLIAGLVTATGYLVDQDKAAFEQSYNQFNPLLRAKVAYLIAVLFVCIGWMKWSSQLLPAAVWAVGIGLLLHTLGLLFRMYIQGRPPVTNLYSSAVFVGWGATLIGMIVEFRDRQGLGSLVAAAIGFATLVVAQGLAASGDTLEQMQAVLDSNFWLATHVVTITLGYSATFLAGFIGLAYVIRLMSGPQDKAFVRRTANLAYGISLFALFLSFVGTVLGGIWADQSWGRFWGWDPKENGALLVVIWNAVILHAKVSGMLRDHGILIAVIVGNIITVFSWFGVNMLGIGLHSYGFMDKAFFWLLVFSASQVLFILGGVIRFQSLQLRG